MSRRPPGGDSNHFRCRHFLMTLMAVAGAHAYNASMYPAMEAEQRLMRQLFQTYDPSVRPYDNISEPVQVSFGVSLVNILALNEKEETLDTYLFLMQAWHDARLEWNRTEYQGVTHTRFPPSKIWKPDIIPYNNVEGTVSNIDTMAVAYASGHVSWITPLRLRTSCRISLRKFPFDEQECSIFFASWVYNGHQVNLTLWGGRVETAFTLETDTVSTEWTVVKRVARIRHKTYSCCPETYPDFIVTLTLRRNPMYYVHVFIVPALLLGLLVPCNLLLPPDSSERMTLGSILFASLLLLTLKLQDALPNAHAELPAVGLFYTLSLVWCALSMMSSIVILNLHSRGPRRGKVPDTIRWIFLRSLKRLVCLGSDTYYLLNDLETISMRGLDHSKPSFNNPVSSSADRRPDQTNTADMRSVGSIKLEREVEEVSRQIHVLGARAHLQDSRAEAVNEWRLVALVLDRVLFFFFFVVYIMCAVIVLA